MAKMYIANEEKLVKALRELEPLLREREKLEKLEPSFANLRGAEVKIRAPHNQVLAAQEKKKQEKEEKKKRGADKMADLGSLRGSRGGDPPKEFTPSFDPSSSGQNLG
jgi:hypothetical protein